MLISNSQDLRILLTEIQIMGNNIQLYKNDIFLKIPPISPLLLSLPQLESCRYDLIISRSSYLIKESFNLKRISTAEFAVLIFWPPDPFRDAYCLTLTFPRGIVSARFNIIGNRSINLEECFYFS